MWPQNTDGVIFVVDANDRDRVDQALFELQKFAAEDELRNAPILVFANKQDLPRAMSTGPSHPPFRDANRVVCAWESWKPCA